MICSTFDQQLEDARHRLDALQTQARGVPEPHLLLSQALQEAGQFLEELRAADEQLHLQYGELLAARQIVETERRRYQELFEFASDGYLVTDALGNIQEANPAAGRLLGVAPGFLINKPLIVFVAEEARDDYRRLIAEIRAGQTVSIKMPMQLRGGAILPAEIQVTAARTGQGFFLLRWMIRNLSRQEPTEKSPGDQPSPLPKEQLSAIGRLLAGLANSSRDALERSRSGLEKLALEMQEKPTALQLLAEIEQGLEELRRLHESIRDYAAPFLLEQR